MRFCLWCYFSFGMDDCCLFGFENVFDVGYCCVVLWWCFDWVEGFVLECDDG